MAKISGLRRRQLSHSLEDDLRTVSTARLSELREIWSLRLGQDPPPLRSREIFRRMLAYRLQAAVHGDLSPEARRKLVAIEARRTSPRTKAKPAPIRLGAGAVLIREWKGVRHEVRVTPDGFSHEEVVYKSLSEVARAISGTRWNGPLFFGLRDKTRVAA
jgi:hypothetical protein